MSIVAAVVGINATLWGLQAVTGGADPGGPTSSSFATGDDGVAAWADLLELRGRDVVRRSQPLSEAPIDPATTLVIADPDMLEDADFAVIDAFLSGGGRLVGVGAFATLLVGPDAEWVPRGVEEATVRGDRGGEARTLVGSGLGSFDGSLPSGVEVLAADGDRVVATVTPIGTGGVVALADSGIVHNERLARGDNAAFALAIVGDDRPVVFLESVHGFGAESGLSALPDTARWALAGLVAAALVGMWCAGQRFGPPEERSRTFPPARTAYVEAMAVALDRSDDRRSAVEPLRQWVRRASDRGTDSFGGIVSPEELAALDSTTLSDADVLAIGRAAARLRTSGSAEGLRVAEPNGTPDDVPAHGSLSTEGPPR